MLTGIVGGIAGSLLDKPPDAQQIDRFFKRIYVPIGRDDQLESCLAEVVPPQRRLLTWGGLFLVKPSRQSWVGFLVTLAICLGAVWFMYGLLQA
jgi:hypothetical protein